MFDIEYKGGNGVVIATKKTTLVADPKLSLLGLHDLATKDVVEVATEARFAKNDPDALLAIEGPGEYEIGDFAIRGIGATRHLDSDADEQLSTVYRIDVGDVRIALIGNISPITLTEDQLENIGLVDLVIVPIGGNGYTLDATSAVSLVRQLDPKAVIPVHYADSTLKYEVVQDPLEIFVKELGAPVETTAKYKVKSNTALPVTLTIIEITRS